MKRVNVVLSASILLIIGAPALLGADICTLGALQPGVFGSPFFSGDEPSAVVYSPIISGRVFAAVVNAGDNTVSVYQVNPTTGVFISVAGSPFDTGALPRFMSFSPLFNGNLYAAIANDGGSTISIFQVDTTTGVFTLIQTFTEPGNPGAFALAYSPIASGNLFLAVTNLTSGTVAIYQIDPITGLISPIVQPPIVSGVQPYSVAYSPVVSGNLFAAVANFGDSTVSMYKVDTITGAFSLVSGLPFPTVVAPTTVTFSPLVNGNLFAAVASQTPNIVDVYQVDTTTGVISLIQMITTGLDGSYDVAYSPLIGGNLFAAIINGGNNTIITYTVDTTTGLFTEVSGSPFPSSGSGPFIGAFSPVLPGGLFLAVANENDITVSVHPVSVFPAIITPSTAVRCGCSLTITACLPSGTPPYTVTWSDGLIQTTTTHTVTRIVKIFATTQYQILTAVDSDDNTTGPSNTITIGAAPTCCTF